MHILSLEGIVFYNLFFFSMRKVGTTPVPPFLKGTNLLRVNALWIVGDTTKWQIRNFRVKMIFRDNRVWSLPIFQSWLLYAFMSGISNCFCSMSDLNSCSNVWCFHLIVLLRNMQEIAKELHACFFGLQRPFSINMCVNIPICRFEDCAHCARDSTNWRSLKLHAKSMRPIFDGENCAHCARDSLNWRSCFV